jgi:aryl-alcohol dehydrogenase-like predicted oxidoreductase
MNALAPMPTRPLGGLQVAAVGLGCNNFGGRLDLVATRRVVHKALDLGVTLFDTADAYGNRGASEDFLGQTLGARRKDIVLATKFGLPMDASGQLAGASPRYIALAVEASLKRLRTDWIDLYQLHRPDPETPIAETLQALDALVRQGKVRQIGCSNLTATRLIAAQETAADAGLAAFVSCQDEYSLLERGIERELIPAMHARALSLLPYFPLAGGLLTGKYRRGAPPPPGARLAHSTHHAGQFINDRNWRIVEELAEFVAQRGRTMLELAFAWLLARPVVASVIAGATTPEQIEANVRAVTWVLSPQELVEIDAITA